MGHDFLILVGIVAAWIASLEFRVIQSKKKIQKIEQETNDAKIAADMRLLSDSKLDAILAKDLSSNESEH